MTASEELAKLSVDAVLSPYVYVFIAAFVVSYLFTPVMKVIAGYYGIVDKPDGARKIHREPIAYLGGVAVFLGWLVGLTISQFLVMHKWPTDISGVNRAPHVPLMIAVGGALIVVLGLVDDIKGMRPKVKIGGQILAACLLLYQGIGRNSMRPLLASLDERMQIWFNGVRTDGLMYVPEQLVTVAGIGMTVALVVFCCNAANLMDGMDGLCGGVTAIISLGYVFLAVHLATLASSTGGPYADALRIILALAVLGGVLGFVPYNFNPASIFMGDTGSMFLGFTIAVSILLLGQEASKWLLASLVMFALPTLDTALAFVRRYVNGRPFFSADKHHIHHQFLARGLSVRQTVLFLYASSIAFVGLGATVAIMRTRYSVALYLVIFGCIIVAAYKMGMIHERVKTVARPNTIGPDDQIDNQPQGQSVGVIEITEERTSFNKEPMQAGEGVR